MKTSKKLRGHSGKDSVIELLTNCGGTHEYLAAAPLSLF